MGRLSLNPPRTSPSCSQPQAVPEAASPPTLSFLFISATFLLAMIEGWFGVPARLVVQLILALGALKYCDKLGDGILGLLVTT